MPTLPITGPVPVSSPVTLTPAQLGFGDTSQDRLYLGHAESPPRPTADFAGRIDELRIYNRVLTIAEIAHSALAGPDASFLPELRLGSPSFGTTRGTIAQTGTFQDLNRFDAVKLTASSGSVRHDPGRSGTRTWTGDMEEMEKNPTITITADDGHGGVRSVSWNNEL